MRTGIALLIFFLALTGCAPETLREKILGKWQEAEGKEVLHFFRSGALVLYLEGERSKARYEIIEPDSVLITFDEWENIGDKPYRIKASVLDDMLTLYAKQEEKRYKRYTKPKAKWRLIWQKSESND